MSTNCRKPKAGPEHGPFFSQADLAGDIVRSQLDRITENPNQGISAGHQASDLGNELDHDITTRGELHEGLLVVTAQKT
jgi:hypothetical protein